MTHSRTEPHGASAQPSVLLGDEVMYRAVSARDRRFDGRFVFAVTSTGIFCRPSCPARTPLRRNVRYFAHPGAATAAGFRACRRCHPEAVPGTRRWDHDRDLAARAVALVQAGTVDDEGVAGLARRLAVSERHLHRVLVGELGVGALALARSRRAQTAQLLLQQTDLPVSDVAYAAGFASIRQFNDVVRSELGATPTQIRRARSVRADRPAAAGPLVLRLATRTPWDAAATLAFVRARALPGVEEPTDDGGLRRAWATTAGPATVHVRAVEDALLVALQLPDLAVLPGVVTSLRRWFDLDADSASVDELLRRDPLLHPLVERRPGVRVPGTVDGFELAVRAVVGQQVSVAAARTLLGRLVARCVPTASHEAAEDDPAAGLLPFPSAAVVAAADLSGLGLTSRRAATLRALAERVAGDDLDLAPGGDLVAQRRALLDVPGVGPWTAEYIALRALADTDAFPATDLVLQRRVAELGADPGRWRPWRAYAALHLWLSASQPPLTPRSPQPSLPGPSGPRPRGVKGTNARSRRPRGVAASPDPSPREPR